MRDDGRLAFEAASRRAGAQRPGSGNGRRFSIDSCLDPFFGGKDPERIIRPRVRSIGFLGLGLLSRERIWRKEKAVIGGPERLCWMLDCGIMM